jgi:hypothetical protein
VRDESDSDINRRFTRRKLNWASNIISDERLTDFQKVVGFTLIYYFNKRTSDCFFKQKTLAQRVRGGVRATQEALDALVDLGYVSVKLWAGPNRTNVYRMLDSEADLAKQSAVETASQSEPACVAIPHQDAPPFSVTMHDDAPSLRAVVREGAAPPFVEEHCNRTLRRNTKRRKKDSIDRNPNEEGATEVTAMTTTNTNQMQLLESDFETFYAAYPKHKDRLKAEQAYHKAITKRKATPAQLLAGAQRYAAERRGQDQQYTKYAASWLNAGGWMDDPASAKHDSILAGLNGYIRQEWR